jgi:23S rRNA (uracil1939-C5)-methyltransferase
MKTCPFFGKCGGCGFDFTAPDYRAKKLALIEKVPTTAAPIWPTDARRRRADFAFLDNKFGFYARGSRDIVPIDNCPLLNDNLNGILPMLARMPWSGAGGVLVTDCDNGIDVVVASDVPYFGADWRAAAEKLPIIRMVWNGRAVFERAAPMVKFDKKLVAYPAGAFLQPSVTGEETLRQLVARAVGTATHVADLFGGLGALSVNLPADVFDIFGNGIKRDLARRPLTPQNLKKYDAVIMDPPRAGAASQSRELARADVPRVAYVSCNPATFMRDMEILLRGGYKLTELTPVDQFMGTAHWELVGVFGRNDK